MNYVYDITLNYNEELIDYYDWNSNDNLLFFLKIPIIKVNEKTIYDFINNYFTVDKTLIDKIKNKNEIYGKNKIENACIFSTDKVSIAFIFNDDGVSIKRSILSIEEENDILDYSKTIEVENINYKLISLCNNNYFLTRKESLINNKLKKIVCFLYNNKKYDILKYIYYEIFCTKEKRIDKVYNRIIDSINKNEINSNKIIFIIEKMVNIKTT